MAAEGGLRVATFNLHHCEGSDGVADTNRAAATLAALAADVVALQEIDRRLSRTGHVDQVTELERSTGMHVSFHPTVHREGGEYGIAVAARERLDPDIVELPGGVDIEPRVALVCELPHGITVVTTHLTRMKHRDVQERQLERVAEIVSRCTGPVVVLGDLNREPGDIEPLLREGLTPAVDAPTFIADRPRRQLDHILVSSGISVAGGGTVATDASDHLPLWADLDIST